MLKRFSLFVASAGLSAFAVPAQERAASKTPPTPAQVYLRNWEDIGRKLIDMAQEFPEDKYDYRPTAEVRSFSEQLLHVIGSNLYVAKTARGGTVPFPELKRADYPTKASIVAAMKHSVADSSEALKAAGEDQTLKRSGLWVGFLEHAGEHYGQLVVYYRLNGIVPPESRPKTGSTHQRPGRLRTRSAG